MVFADEALISRTVRSIDLAAQKVALETTTKGKTQRLTIDIKPASWTVRFTCSTEPGNIGFVERTATLGDLKLGWVVSVTTKHEGGHEVADIVKVVLER